MDLYSYIVILFKFIKLQIAWSLRHFCRTYRRKKYDNIYLKHLLLGDCLAQKSAGDDTLLSPEPGLFILGMKSYGRGSAFLLR